MRLQFAYLCNDCSEINDRAPHGVCQRCGSQSVLSLARVLSQNPAALAAPRPKQAAPLNFGRRPLAERL